MSPVVAFVILTGLASVFVWWLGFRATRRDERAHEGEAHTRHGRAA